MINKCVKNHMRKRRTEQRPLIQSEIYLISPSFSGCCLKFRQCCTCSDLPEESTYSARNIFNKIWEARRGKNFSEDRGPRSPVICSKLQYEKTYLSCTHLSHILTQLYFPLRCVLQQQTEHSHT